MKTINICKAKKHLSELIQEVLNGEEVVITRYGIPLVRMEPYSQPYDRKPGYWKNQFRIAKDFDELPQLYQDIFDRN